jgi:hypothetical protein
MQLINKKTGVIFSTRTTKTAGGFAAIVTRQEGKTAFLIDRAIFPTRSAAYQNAKQSAVYAFRCHCNAWGM